VNYGESVTKAGDFMKQLPVEFTVLLDANQEAARAWRVRLLPASFVVDADGQVRHTVIGEMDWSSDAAVKAVAALVR
jgi:peroxiredoxin